MARHRGFTLVEVLVALGLLGTVAAFTIPKVLQTQGDTQKKALFKETIAAINEVYYSGSIDGTLPRNATTWAPMQTYLLDRLNAIAIYRGDNPPATEACVVMGAEVEGRGPCVLMPNGVAVQALDEGTENAGGGPVPDEMFLVDYNGKAGPNLNGQDILLVHTPLLGNQPVVVKAWSSPVLPANKPLWDSVFQ